MNLQEQINIATPGATITIPDNETCIGSFVINKPLNITGGVGSKIIAPQISPTQFVAEPPIVIPPGTGPVSLTGLEITIQEGVKQAYDLIRYGAGGAYQNSLDKAPQGLTIDRCDIHGLPNTESQRGISANGANFKITNSKVWEIHGKGYDTQAVCTWNGPGPFLLEDCYFEAAGENVMFGGAPPSIPGLIHSDIQVRRCKFFKPVSWRGVWSVKNLFELKNARRVIVEGCTFENNWTDAQAGRAIVFTPRPGDSGPAALIEDVVFQNNTIKNVGSGMLLLGIDDPPQPQDVRLKRVKILNNLWLNINGPEFGSNGAWLTVVTGTENVTAEHNTVIQTGAMIISDGIPNTGFVCRYNISRHNDYGVIGSGKSMGKPSLDFYFPGHIFAENVIAKEVNAPWNADQLYPAGNKFPATLLEAIGSDYKPTQAYVGLGCDVDKLNAAQGGTTAPMPAPSPTPTPTPSPTPPSTSLVTILSPASDSTLSGITTVEAKVADSVSVNEAYIVVDDSSTRLSGVSPYSYKLDTTKLAEGKHSLFVRVWDSSGKGVDSPRVSFTVVNAAPSPTPTPTPAPAPTPPLIRKLAQPSSEAKWNTLLAQQKAEGYFLTKFLTGSWVEFQKITQ